MLAKLLTNPIVLGVILLVAATRGASAASGTFTDGGTTEVTLPALLAAIRARLVAGGWPPDVLAFFDKDAAAMLATTDEDRVDRAVAAWEKRSAKSYSTPGRIPEPMRKLEDYLDPMYAGSADYKDDDSNDVQKGSEDESALSKGLDGLGNLAEAIPLVGPLLGAILHKGAESSRDVVDFPEGGDPNDFATLGSGKNWGTRGK